MKEGRISFTVEAVMLFVCSRGVVQTTVEADMAWHGGVMAGLFSGTDSKLRRRPPLLHSLQQPQQYPFSAVLDIGVDYA